MRGNRLSCAPKLCVNGAARRAASWEAEMVKEFEVLDNDVNVNKAV